MYSGTPTSEGKKPSKRKRARYITGDTSRASVYTRESVCRVKGRKGSSHSFLPETPFFPPSLNFPTTTNNPSPPRHQAPSSSYVSSFPGPCLS